MIKRVLFFLILFLQGEIFAQWTGSKTPYHPQQTIYTAAPKGYRPFFVNHVGRHGSRFMTKTGSDSLLLQFLEQAKVAHGLSDLGEKWIEKVKWLIQIQKGHYGDISLLGAEEQHHIADRLRRQYPSVFHQGKIDVWYTHKIRTHQSAQGFLQSFTDYPKININYLTQSETDETMLRFYDYSPVYDAYIKSTEVKAKIDSIQNIPCVFDLYDTIAYRFIDPKIWQYWAKEKKMVFINGNRFEMTPSTFTTALFDVYAVGLSAKLEMKSAQTSILRQWKSPFTNREGTLLGEANDVEDYLIKGPGLDKNGIQSSIALPLLIHFINTGDSASKGILRKEGVFRFTHAEAIAPFATLLGIKGTDSVVHSISDFSKVWHVGSIIPMAANIQWIFYSKGKSVLVKILLNEKEAALPISTKHFPYYKWEDVKSFYRVKIKHLQSKDR